MHPYPLIIFIASEGTTAGINEVLKARRLLIKCQLVDQQADNNTLDRLLRKEENKKIFHSFYLEWRASSLREEVSHKLVSAEI